MNVVSVTYCVATWAVFGVVQQPVRRKCCACAYRVFASRRVCVTQAAGHTSYADVGYNREADHLQSGDRLESE